MSKLGVNFLRPSVKDHRNPATFVSTGRLRGEHDEGGALGAVPDRAQGREPADAGKEIGGHGHSRPQLDQLDAGRLRSETLRRREVVGEEPGTAPVPFAHPYGYSSRRVRRAAREAGFAQALAVGDALARRQGPYALERVTVRRSTGTEEFARPVEGRAIARDFAAGRAVTKGCALVRRARGALRGRWTRRTATPATGGAPRPKHGASRIRLPDHGRHG